MTVKLVLCPRCGGRKRPCPSCKGDWEYSEAKQPEQKVYDVIYHDVKIPNAFYKSSYIETTHNYVSDSLGSTFGEYNESLYLRMITLSHSLGDEITSILCSTDWWYDFWQHCSWITHCSPSLSPKGMEVARVHGNKPVYITDAIDGYWIAVECPKGIAQITINVEKLT